MSFRLIPALKPALLGAALLSLSALTASAENHPHDKESKAKASSKTDPIVEFEQDLNAHFERHAKTLRDALNSAKGTQSRIIVKELRGEDDDALAGSSLKGSKRIEIIENPDDLREAARSIQNLLAESGILESLADVVIELAEDVELEDTGKGMRLSFDGTRIGGFSVDENNDSLSIETMGSNTTIEKEVFIENGKKRTRIVIETDSDDVDFDIVPKAKKRRSGTEF